MLPRVHRESRTSVPLGRNPTKGGGTPARFSRHRVPVFGTAAALYRRRLGRVGTPGPIIRRELSGAGTPPALPRRNLDRSGTPPALPRRALGRVGTPGPVPRRAGARAGYTTRGFSACPGPSWYIKPDSAAHFVLLDTPPNVASRQPNTHERYLPPQQRTVIQNALQRLNYLRKSKKLTEP